MLAALIAAAAVWLPTHAATRSGTISVDVRCGGKPVAGAWARIERTGESSPSFPSFASGVDGVAKIYNLPTGAYSVRVFQPSCDSSDPIPAAVTAGGDTHLTIDLSPVPSIRLIGPQGKGWKALPLPSLGGPGFTLPDDMEPAKIDYPWDSGHDPSINAFWRQNVPVPSDIGGSVGGGTEGLVDNYGSYWYRYTLPVAGDPRFRSRLWLLQGYSVTDEDNAYWNGRLIGSTRKNTEFDSASTPRVYALSAGDFNPNGPNVVAILGRHRIGPAGITAGVPTLVGLPRGTGNVEVAVSDASGQPLDGTAATLTSPDGAFHPSAQTRAGGPARFFGVPEGRYSLSVGRPYGMETFADSDVSVSAGKTTQTSISAIGLPYVALDSATRDRQGEPGWRLLPIPSDESDRAAADVSIADPAYGEPKVDPMFSAEWVPGAPAPFDLGEGDPPDPSRPVENNSYFWYRLTVATPLGWSRILPGRDLELSGYSFASEDWAFVNGILVGHATDGRVRRYRIPRSLIHFGDSNVIAIKGHATRGRAGIVAGPIALGFAPMTDSPRVTRGDLSGDGAVGVEDVVLELKASLGLIAVSADQLRVGDLLRRGTIDLEETTLLLRAVVGLSTL